MVDGRADVYSGSGTSEFPGSTAACVNSEWSLRSPALTRVPHCLLIPLVSLTPPGTASRGWAEMVSEPQALTKVNIGIRAGLSSRRQGRLLEDTLFLASRV